jgi:uncharacterized protein YdcH (DUF465 family)
MQSHTEHADDEELKAHLLATDEHFRTLNDQHLELKRQVEAMESKSHVTEADELEEQRLKKLKLALKDQMTEIISNLRQVNVA